MGYVLLIRVDGDRWHTHLVDEVEPKPTRIMKHSPAAICVRAAQALVQWRQCVAVRRMGVDDVRVSLSEHPGGAHGPCLLRAVECNRHLVPRGVELVAIGLLMIGYSATELPLLVTAR